MPKRPTDRVEDVVASVLAFALLVAAVVAALAGVNAYGSVLELARAQAAARTPIVAVLAQDTPRPRAGESTVTAPVRWTEADGVERTGQTQAPGGQSAGTPVRIWVDRSHHIVPQPAGEADALIAGFGLAAALLTGAALLATVLWKGTRCWTLARNRARWERDWAQVEPSWRGRYL
ncbi:Rv1733c family protein [Pseudonocardia acaciae]|uniref:Rv1733c family protein n=1 Tax=Pseudonocardia acaciae TaxID=551276 RepID=UPI000685793C|nr:hypothetical protein [Pseudonocardia acaciae]